MTNRRQFLFQSTGLLAGAAFSSSALALQANNRYRSQIVVQLYTLRNELKKNEKETLQAVKDAGYFQGETYGFPNSIEMITPARDVGLEVHSSHFNWESVTDPDKEGVEAFDSILAKAKEAELKHLVIPYVHAHNRETLEDYQLLAERCNKAAVKCKEAGIQLAYHNHAFEFEPKNDEGKSGFDIFVDEFAPEMKFEIDLFWVVVGGRNGIETLNSLKGRVSQLHLKDLSKEAKTPNFGSVPKEHFEELGDGQIAMEPFLKAAADLGVDICHVEQDHSPHPVKSIQQSFNYLKGL
ncbi:MAG: sugar phosphate isomerase/epimerase [Verrucomicrobiota bacterium]